MTKIMSFKSVRLCGLGGLAVFGLWAGQARAQYDPDWVHHVWVGPLVGLNIDAKFSINGQFPISGSQPGPAGVSGVDHIYSDGYVKVDQTGNAQGYTTYWGYNNASQYDSTTHLLTMHSTDSYATRGSASQGDDPYLGVELGYGAQLWRFGEKFRVGFDFGFGLLPIRITDEHTLPAIVSQSSYTFDTGNVIVPEAPYNGGPSGYDQPVIHDVATALPVNTSIGAVPGKRTLDTILYTFRLGPSVYYDLSRRVGLMASAGGALGLMSGDLKFDETVHLPDGSSTVNKGSIGGTDVVFGGYVSASAIFHIVSHGDVYVSAEFMPMGNPKIDEPGRGAELDLSGAVYFSAGFNWSF